PASLYLAYGGMNGSVYDVSDDVAIPSTYHAKNFRIAYSWKSDIESHSSGLNLEGASSPNLQLTLNTTAPLPPNIQITTYVFYSKVCEFTQNSILYWDSKL